jgi:myosin heavy subunit
MGNILGIVTTFVLLSSAFLAYQNKGRYDLEIQHRQESKEALDKTVARVSKAKADLESTVVDRRQTEDEVGRVKRDIEDQARVNAEFAPQKASKETQVAENKVKLDDVRQKMEGYGDLETLGSKMRTTRSEIEELEGQIAQAESQVTHLTSENTRLESVSQDQRALTARFVAKESSPNLKTRINAIYPNWGFVTLAAGNNAGIVTDSTLAVVRDGETIAKLQVAATESGTSSATIVPDSMKADTVLMVGDSVVSAPKSK